MSERILKALMKLFAIVSDPFSGDNKNRKIVEIFLKQQLNQDLVKQYLELYDQYFQEHTESTIAKSSKKKTSLSSVKILRICTQINADLTQVQKIIVLLRIFEYIYFEKSDLSELEKEITVTISDTFNISPEEYDKCYKFTVARENSIPEDNSILIIGGESHQNAPNKTIIQSELDSPVIVLRIDSVNLYFFKYFGKSEIYLNGQIISPQRSYILNSGSSIRGNKLHPTYYSDIQKRFLSEKGFKKIIFKANHVTYEFKNGNIGINDFEIEEESGKLIAIMGGSGTGKSTLLNILNGNLAPTYGSVCINGVDIHKEKDKIEGVIGYVSQDDLLIEELTVYQNLYYNAKLCFKDLSDEEIRKKVDETLHNLGIQEIQDLKVGNPLEKTISGGQRKRVNIGLELIREPSVLFADEPTSGLSSRDSENIMDLLKELTLKGKLVFVVIHQPSSDIFKMFDQLIILDVGGYPVYYGNPVDSVVYFKTLVNHVNANESECIRCGNVNPEQIFNTLESRILDEYGNVTDNRKVSPKKWNEYYKENIQSNEPEQDTEKLDVPNSTFNVPSRFQQLKVFLTRDLRSKLTNNQYLLVNLIETPLLAFILAFFTRYYDSDVNNKLGYAYIGNENIPVYLFMAVVVALFIGMTVSAEEIIRDQKIRKRESFLNLSNGTYLLSKIILMFVVSSIQTFLFILVGNTILGVHNMTLSYWLVLFSTSCFANMVGLNISATFNSAVTIYILIPFLLIPQLLFSGIIVKFDKLNPATTSQTEVPIIGEAMASRWAFEALAVHQFKNNEFEKIFYKYDKVMSIAKYKKNFWIPKVVAKIDLVESNLKKDSLNNATKSDLSLLRNEIKEEEQDNYRFKCTLKDSLYPSKISLKVLEQVKEDFASLNKFYIHAFNIAANKKDSIIQDYYKKENGKEKFNALKQTFENTSLTDLVTNKKDLQFILELDNKLVQKTDPVFLDPDGFRAHFYAPNKKLFGKKIDTFWANIMVLWTMSLFLAITLYFDFFKKIISLFEFIFQTARFQKTK